MENFNKWLEINMETAKQLPLTELLSQTWYAGFVAALIKGDKEKAISSILNAKKENISMKIFIALILEKARLVILLSNANITESIKKEVGEDEYNKIQELSSIKDSKLKASTLIELLKAYDMVGRSYIESLPLELLAIELK
jgi:hypothetical protein